jgi:hypothetical protein
MTRISLALLVATFPMIAHAALQVERLEQTAKGTEISYRMADGEPLKTLSTTLYDIKELGVLKADEEAAPPHLLVVAKPCASCNQEKGIYLIRFDGTQPMHFIYPGRIVDPKSRALLFDSRAFFGKCLSHEKGDVYVVFQREKVDRRRALQSSVYVAEPAKQFVEERLIERHMPRIRYTLHRVKAKQCHAIEGWNRLMLAKPLDLKPRHIGDDDDDEDTDHPGDEDTSGASSSDGSSADGAAATEVPAE